ncbi:MAG TPA: PQQ-dependent sugar dehydrogenase [Thermoleophilaceae bacterium]
MVAAAAVLAVLPAAARAAISLPPDFQEVTLASGFGAPGGGDPVDATWAPDGRMFVSDRAGVIWVHDPGDPATQNAVLLNISDHVNNGPGTDHGLLGIATDTDFATNGFLYLLYTYDESSDLNYPDSTNRKVSVLTRVTVNPNNTVVGGTNSPTETTILGTKVATVGSGADGSCGAPSNTNNCIPSEGLSHSIGTVRAAPDGTLFVGSGDGSDFVDVDPLALNDFNDETYRGKIMHIDRNGNGLAGHPFCPGDNTLADVCTKIYAEGLRNPFRFTLRPGGGLAIGDVGQNAFEEIDLASGGENFGWPCFEGAVQDPFVDPSMNTYETFPQCQALYANKTTTAPAFNYPHNYTQCTPSSPNGNTIVGGPVYDGDKYPAAYRGQLFFGNVGDIGVPGCGWIGRATISGGSLTNFQVFATSWPGSVDLDTAPDGNLVYVSLKDDAVREIEYGGAGGGAAGGGSAGGGSAGGGATSGAGGPTTKARLVPLALSRASAGLVHGGLLGGGFASADAVRKVNVSVWRGRAFASSCHWWSKRSHSLKRGSCKQPHWLAATLHRKGQTYSWALRLGGTLPPGSYTLVLQALPRGSTVAPSARLRRHVRVRG